MIGQKTLKLITNTQNNDFYVNNRPLDINNKLNETAKNKKEGLSSVKGQRTGRSLITSIKIG